MYQGFRLALSIALSAIRKVGSAVGIIDTNADPDVVSSSATNGTVVPITPEVQNPKQGVTYSNWEIVSQSVTGAFAINSLSGQITVADATKLTTV